MIVSSQINSIWFFCITLVCSTTFQLTPMGVWVMFKLVLCCDINKFKIATTKELSGFGRLFSCFQCQFKSWMGWDQPLKMQQIMHWKNLVKYQLLNIKRTLTLPILLYINFHMWKIDAKVCKCVLLMFNICGEGKEDEIGLRNIIQFFFFVPTFKLNVLSLKLW
jgi:hypothetical protein